MRRSQGEDRLTQIDHLHHLWFLWFLLWLVGGFAVSGRHRGSSEVPVEAFGLGRVMWLMIPVTIIPQLNMGDGGAYPIFGSDTSDALLPIPHVLLYYAIFFTFGAHDVWSAGP